MGKKNHFINVRLTDSQAKFIRELTADAFKNNMSDAIRFCIDYLSVMLNKGIIVDLSEYPEIAEKLNPNKIKVDWDEMTENGQMEKCDESEL